LAFEELHDLLVGYEAYLICLEVAMQQQVTSTNSTKTKQSTQWGVNSGPSSEMLLHDGLTALTQAKTLMEPSMKDIAPTTTLAGLIIPIDITNPNAKFVIN
jgi:hypothetical protein